MDSLEMLSPYILPIDKMLETALAFLNKVPQIDEGFRKLEEATNQPRKNLLGGVVSFLALLTFFISGARSFSYLVGFVYPTFRSFQAIQSPEAGDDKKWLGKKTFWCSNLHNFLLLRFEFIGWSMP